MRVMGAEEPDISFCYKVGTTPKIIYLERTHYLLLAKKDSDRGKPVLHFFIFVLKPDP